MCIALIGGMDRLERHYIEEAERAGVDLRVFNKSEVNIGSKIRNVEAMVIFTNKVSHRVKAEAMK
jgi:poly(3-hydroxyalkanoate) synthetase